MNAYIFMGLVFFVLLVFFLLQEYFSSKKWLEKCIEKARKSYGTFSEVKFSDDELNNIKKLFYRYKDEDSVDDITAADLDLDEVFLKFNNCLSAPGREYFYYMLRTPKYNPEYFEALEKKVKYFEENEEIRNNFRAHFLQIGNMRKANFFECVDLFDNVNKRNTLKEYLLIAAILISVGLMFVSTTVGIILFLVTVIYNILDYYKVRGEIEAYIILFSYISNFLKHSKKIAAIKSDVLEEELNALDELSSKLKSFERFSSIVTGKNSANIGAGNPLDILVDYLKMVFHIDIIRFYRMLDIVKSNKETLEEIYLRLGMLEAYINIASVRKAVESFCVPETGAGLSGTNIYHPLVKNPVKNDIKTDKGVLITGSNASGKSTFLKSVALNALFSKTIYTCLADTFIMDDYHIFSSMALKDDIVHKDSYFMVEIKALKRIFDYCEKNPDKKVLCFVDEVLRGTNTIERIACVTRILMKLNSLGVLCFAATHDGELTELLDSVYDNYHFDEEFKENDILFNYRIKTGRATSKNAIKLLSIMGFEKEIVNEATRMANAFSDSGVWSV